MTLKLYRIHNWSTHFENNRSRTVERLSWVAIPNRHDGENYSALITHPDAAEMFAAWVLLVQVASKCQPRGSLLRGDGKPHNAASLSMKTRAPEEWFEKCLAWLEDNTDWLEIQDVAGGCQAGDIQLSGGCQAPDEEGREGNERKGGTRNASLSPLIQEVFDGWNRLGNGLPQCLQVSDKRRRTLEVRLRDPFFLEYWKLALEKVKASAFCRGDSDRGWKASFDWFISPDAVAKLVEGKYDGQGKPKGPPPRDDSEEALMKRMRKGCGYI